jgi:hypothetical protein
MSTPELIIDDFINPLTEVLELINDNNQGGKQTWQQS